MKELIRPSLVSDEYMFTRCSNYYLKNEALWRKAIDAYNGGRAYINATLKKHPSETTEEFTDRKNSAYNINLIKYSTGRFGDYIFAKPPRRKKADNALLEDFDRQKKSINSVMREMFDYHTICNLVWALVNMPTFEGDSVDGKTKKDNKIRPWCKALSPLKVPDWEFDEFGELEWIIIEEYIVDKKDPNAVPETKKQRTLYTKTYWKTYTAVIDSTKAVSRSGITVSKEYKNTLGKVPVIAYTNILFNECFNHPAIDDILTINDAVLAGESELLTNIIKQTYGQLVLPSSASSMVNRIKTRRAQANPDIDVSDPAVHAVITQEANIELSRTKAIFEEAEERGTARYIQPEGATTDSIIGHNDRLMSIMMKLYGFLVGVHTTQKESAESKSVDNISLAAQLTSISSRLQELENGIWQLFKAYDSSVPVPTIEYNTDYDLHELKAVIMSIVELINIDAGDEYQRQVKRTATHVMNSIHHIEDATHEKIMNEIDAGKGSAKPSTFEAQATHAADVSGMPPDSISTTNAYQSSKTAKVSKTEAVK